MLKSTSLILFVTLLAGCSVYESAGRKFLENSAYQYAGVSAQANLTSCNREAPAASKNWELLDRGTDATLYSTEAENFELRVQTAEDPSFNCYYKFNSAQELYTQARPATELSLSHLNAEWVPPAATPPKTR